MSETVQLNYTTINHEARKKLGLTTDEYCIADIIHNLSTNPGNKEGGWCYASKDTIASFLGIHRATVFRIINKLTKKGLMERNPEVKNLLKSTSLWFETTIIKESQNATDSRKLRLEQSQNATEDSLKMRHNKDNNNKDNDKTTSKDVAVITATNGELKEFGDPKVNAIVEVFLRAYGHLPNRREQRKYASMLERKFGLERVLQWAQFAVDIAEDEFAPKVTSPHQLWNKWNEIILFANKHTKLKPRLFKASDVAKYMKGVSNVVQNS